MSIADRARATNTRGELREVRLARLLKCPLCARNHDRLLVLGEQSRVSRGYCPLLEVRLPADLTRGLL